MASARPWAPTAAIFLWLVQRQVLRLTAIRRTLYEVQPLDPITVAAAATILGAVALLAGWLPAWRASRVDPVRALRDE